MRLAAITLLIFSAISFEAFAKNCKNGQPCGNSCISWSKTCRIGTTSTYRVPAQPSTTYRSYSAPAAAPVAKPVVPIIRQDVPQPTRQQSKLFAQTDAAFVFELPSRSANRIRRLTFGEQITVYETLGEWARISAGGAAEEWVLSTYLGQSAP